MMTGLLMVALALALYNIGWTWPAMRCLYQGKTNPPILYNAFIFLASATMSMYFIRSLLFHDNVEWLLFARCAAITTAALGVIGHRMGAGAYAEKLALLDGSLPEALAIAELGRRDKAAAQALAAKAWEQMGRGV